MIKKLALICMVLIFYAKVSYAQKASQVNIPLVRESQKIDFLLDKYVKLGDPAKSCFVLYADPIVGLYGLSIRGIRTDTAVLNLNFFNYKADIGYFRYKKFLVFVVNTYDLFDFFDQTTHYKTIKYKPDAAGANNKQRYFCSADVNYTIGEFSPMIFNDPVPRKEMTVQAVVPSKKIDSLLEKYTGLSDPSRSCFLINSQVSNGEYSLSISGLRTDTTLLNVNVFRRSTELGYYRYRGFLVFAKINDDPYHYFTKTGSSRRFNIEWDERKAEDKELNPLGETFCFNNYFRDRQGRFEASVIFDQLPKRTIKTEYITLVKQDRKIDEVFERLKITAAAINTFYLISSSGPKENYHLTVEKIRCDTSLIKLHTLTKANLKVFRYKNNIVFLAKESDPYNFFPETPSKQAFKFESYEPDTFFDANQISMTILNYRNDRFEIPERR